MEEIKNWIERNVIRREARRERIRAMLRRAVVLRAGEPIPVIGDSFGGGVVVSSFPEVGDPNIIVEIPEDVISIRSILRDRILEERDENPDYKVLGFDSYTGFDVESAAQVGDTYALVGITEDVRRRGNYGAGDVISGMGDTGYYPEHSAYIGKNPYWWSPWSSTPRDSHGHGTHVSALQFGSGEWGIATDAACSVFQVLNDASGVGSESDIANAFRAIGDYVLAQRVRAGVFNFSLGGRHSGVINAGVSYMLQRNVWVIAAAGNDGPEAAIGSPGDAPGVVCVGAADRNFGIAPFSSGGGTAPGISCFSEGVEIASALTGTVNGQKVMSGTSMATPHVTALFTLLAAAGMSFDEAKAYVYSHMQTLSPACSNGRGLFVIAADFGAVSNPPVEPPPDTGEPPMPNLEKTDALCDEQIDVLDSSGTEYDLGMELLTTLQANYPRRMPVEARNVVNDAIAHLKVARYGPDSTGGYVRAMDLAWEIKNSLPKVEAPPIEAPPTKPPLVPDWLKDRRKSRALRWRSTERSETHGA
jgi:subtilisin family serine protease